MKTPSLIPFAAIALLAVTGCDKQSPEVAKKIADLEQKTQAAADRQRELEQEIEDQKLAVERDAIERERVRIEEDRLELVRLQGEAAAAQDEAIRRREEELSNREVKLERIQASLEEQEDELAERDQQLSDSERELAGREALPFEYSEQSEPVADYDMFYDSLSSYGSWFETSDYGYVWQPAVVRDSNWRPYSRGRWACSDRGWTWISEEPFGWATYHYGRWALLRGRGWIWVPGTEWAPSWVSWRENDSHIGWAPLPPETLAYRGHHWDSTVDVQFGISAACFNFVEIRNFGSSIYSHCLPVSSNGNWFVNTVNITYIHIQNRQIICGGPKYKRISERVGRQLPFYRLEVDRHPRPSRDALGLRPRIRGNHLVVSAPNIDAPWNDSLKPKRIKDRLENVKVERNGELSSDIRNRYRQNRQESRERAVTTIAELGGAERFEEQRNEKLAESRRQADTKARREERRDGDRSPARVQREVPGNRLPGKTARPAERQVKVDPLPEKVVRQSNGNRPRPEVPDARKTPAVRETPRITPAEEEAARRPQTRPQRQTEPARETVDNDSAQRQNTARRQQEEARREQQLRAEQAREAQQEAMKRREEEQAQQRRQQEKQREAEEAREARRQAMEQERAQRQAQEEARQRQQERAQRQQQAEQEREMQRQQERAEQRQQEQARQRQEEQSRQRQQEENQRRQEQSRQRQQEENQRQRQQEETRQKQEKDQKDQEEQRRRNR